MALNATTLSAAMRAALLANASATKAVDGPALTAFCDAVASTVVAHITSSASLVVVTSCPAGAGTGTGTVA